MSSLSDAQQLLDQWASGNQLPSGSRLADALASLRVSERQASSDVPVLIRQILRHNDALRLGSSPSTEAVLSLRRSWLTVPKDGLLGESLPWSTFGISFTSAGSERIQLTADPWEPTWIRDPGDQAVDHDVARLATRRLDESTPPDPFLTEIDDTISSYRTPSQRSAVRSAFLVPPGGTLLINLPTGAGKTLPLLARALLTPVGKTSVVVVPTVALALDQERRYAAQRPDGPPTAYIGDLSKDRKSDFFARLRAGTQPVIFTNPEAAVTSLAGPLLDAASGGRLAMLGIDEAHVVGSWGDAFRPHFQALAGFRNALARAAIDAGHEPLRTLLTTATVTQQTLGLLRTLFGWPAPFLHLAAPVVRPEPTFWGAEFERAESRQDRLLEALRHLPRPAIVYTTLRQGDLAKPGLMTPRRLAEILKSEGFRRVAAFDGESSPAEREAVLEGFRAGERRTRFDIVVATSAFGLGIDVPDVRTIVHACIPESLDRYYQEVGRAGRDGKASISIVLSTKDDTKVAESMASPRMVTAELARDRWRAMYSARVDAGGGLIALPLTALHAELAANTDYNERWNLFTVGLMARAGALEWDFSTGPALPPDADAGHGWITVRMKRGDHDSDRFWTEDIEPVRASVVDNGKRSLAALRKGLRGDVCMGKQLADNYSIDDSPAVRTLRSCSGCSWCRRNSQAPLVSPSPSALAVGSDQGWKGGRALELSRRGRFGNRITIVAESDLLTSRRRMRQLLESMVLSEGVRLLVAPRHVLTELRASMPDTRVTGLPPLFSESLEDFDPLQPTPVATLIVVSALDMRDWMFDGLRSVPLAITVVADSPGMDASRTTPATDGCYAMSDYERLR